MSLTAHSIPARDRSRPTKLSFQQQRLWILSRQQSASDAYHISMRLVLDGDLNVDCMRNALIAVCHRHEAIRTHFSTEGGFPVQLVVDREDFDARIRFIDLFGHASTEKELGRVVVANECEPFDLANGPLFRACIIKTDERRYVLNIALHHIIADRWSMGVLRRDLTQFYNFHHSNEVDREAAPVPAPLPIQYPDYCAWQRDTSSHDRLLESLHYWRKELDEAPPFLSLQTDYPRSPVPDFRGEQVKVVLMPDLMKEAQLLGRKHGCTLHATLMTAWAIVMSRAAGQGDVVIGTPVASRNIEETENLIGFFASTMPIRFQVDGQSTLGNLLENTANRVTMARRHQAVPFEAVADATSVGDAQESLPTFNVVFAWQNTPRGNEHDFDGLKTGRFRTEARRVTSRFDLSLIIQQEHTGHAVGYIEYATSLFHRSTIDGFIAAFRMVLQSMVAMPTARISELASQDDAAREHLLAELARGVPADVADVPMHRQFEERARCHPQAPAVIVGDEVVSYEELNRRAHWVAERLQAQGTRAGSYVMVSVQRGTSWLAALLGILKCGACYVPIDPSAPPERVLAMASACRPITAIIDASADALFNHVEVNQWRIDRDTWSTTQPAITDAGQGDVSLAHPAYVIFTSGTTGAPKGVMIKHDSLNNLCAALARDFRVSRKSKVLQYASIAFDASIWEICMALTQGACLDICPDDVRASARQLGDFVATRGISHATLPPAVFQGEGSADAFLHDVDHDLLVVLAGEGPTAALLDSLADKCTVVNAYGPTESTVCASFHFHDAPRWGGKVLIGRPLINSSIYLLDDARRPVPAGTSGEIYIAGRQVAAGYLGDRPENANFMDDPYGSYPGARMYRSGDFGRYTPSGEIEYLGRVDSQIKIRGFRIELREIEAVLCSHPDVKDCIVTLETKGLLAAYLVMSAPDATLASVKAFAKARLPSYMVPARAVIVDRFPLTVNGKIDAAALRRLPSPDSHASGSSPDNPPIGDGEILIARLWSELLDTPIASRDANFFEMGGNSLLAAVFAERMRACGRAFPGMRIFERPVLSDLAAALASPVQATLGPAVIPVRRRQGGTNVFFFPTGTGDYSYTFELATDMDSSIGIYALPWPDSLDGVDLDALARAMCEAMMCVQPAGPYLLCGYSLGGLLAHAVAAHLLRSGHPVSFIGLIDVPTGSPYQENGAPKTPRNFILRSIRSKAAQKSPEALEQAVDFIHRARTWAMVDIIEQGRSIGLLNPPAERTSAEMAIAWERSFGFLQAASCYRPGPESMSIEIFQATLQEHHDAPPSPAWNEISPSYDIHTTHVDGGHEDLMNVPETRRQLAAALSRRILLAMPERELAG